MSPTVGSALEDASQRFRDESSTPRLDAQVLLMNVIGKPRSWVLAHPESELNEQQMAEFGRSVEQVLSGVALPHVLGWWEFYGRRFQLTRAVLIPRPETELMVETALGLPGPITTILDVGTGCGCIAVTLALELPDSKILASDISRPALMNARANVLAYGLSNRVSLVWADLMSAFEGPHDLICANLPYVPASQLHELEVGAREPALALDGGTNGTQITARAIAQLPHVLSSEGTALFEIDPSQIGLLSSLIHGALPDARLTVKTDLAGHERLLVIDRG